MKQWIAICEQDTQPVVDGASLVCAETVRVVEFVPPSASADLYGSFVLIFTLCAAALAGFAGGRRA